MQGTAAPMGAGRGGGEERRHLVRFMRSVIFSQVVRWGSREQQPRQREQHVQRHRDWKVSGAQSRCHKREKEDVKKARLYPGAGLPWRLRQRRICLQCGRPGFDPRSLGRAPGEGRGNPLQYSCLENPRDRGAWQVTVHGTAKSRTRLSGLHVSWSERALGLP